MNDHSVIIIIASILFISNEYLSLHFLCHLYTLREQIHAKKYRWLTDLTTRWLVSLSFSVCALLAATWFCSPIGDTWTHDLCNPSFVSQVIYHTFLHPDDALPMMRIRPTGWFCGHSLKEQGERRESILTPVLKMCVSLFHSDHSKCTQRVFDCWSFYCNRSSPCTKASFKCIALSSLLFANRLSNRSPKEVSNLLSFLSLSVRCCSIFRLSVSRCGDHFQCIDSSQ